MPLFDADARKRLLAGDRLGAIATTLRRITGRTRAGVGFAAGALSVLAFAPFFWWPVLFLTLPVLVWFIDGAGEERDRGARLKAAFGGGFWFGFGYFFAGLFWVGEAFLVEADKFGWALPFAVTLLPAGLALYWGAAAALARMVWPRDVRRLFVLAGALFGAEWLRGHVLTGFPWNTLGYALTGPDVLMQSAGLAGVYGLTLWAVVIFASPLVMAADAPEGAARRRGLGRGLLMAGLPLLAFVGYGVSQLAGGPPPMQAGVRLRLVQPAVDQREKWKPENQGPIFRDHLALSRQDPTGRVDDMAGITHVIWPEAAMPFLPLEHPEALAAIGDAFPDGTVLLSGALRREPGGPGVEARAFNSLMAFDGTGQLITVYDKTHLVPFGEYLPVRRVLSRIGLSQLAHARGSFNEGQTPRPSLALPGLPPLGILICYEAIFPDLVFDQEGTIGALINITNDGWFGNTTGPRQHFHQARVRAVEQGVPLIRAANNGISAVIDGRGRVLSRLDLNQRGVIDSGLPQAASAPVYVRLGGWAALVNSLVFLTYAAIFGLISRKGIY